MKRRRHYLACILLVVFAIILTTYFLPSGLPSFRFIPNDATFFRLPDADWVVYEFPADFNSIMPEVESELRKQGFVRARVWPHDLNKRWTFDRIHKGEEVVVEVHNKRLGSVGKAAMEGEWVSVSINGCTVVNQQQRIMRSIWKIRSFVWRLMQYNRTSG
jgi:hypothetical protein